MQKIKDQKLCFLKVSFHIIAWFESFTPLTNALILQDICRYSTGIQDLKSSADSPLKNDRFDVLKVPLVPKLFNFMDFF